MSRFLIAFSGPLTLAKLTFFFLGGVALLLLIANVLFFANIARLESEFSARNEKQAKQELQEAMVLMEDHMRKVANNLASWDETKQQLVDPTYYAYWRNSRILSSGLLPATTDGIELYDNQGRSLSNETHEADSNLPRQISPRDLRLHLLREAGHDHFLLFFPIYNEPSHVHLLGYGGLKLDFAAELQTLRRFLYIDLSSVRITAPENQPLSVEDALQHMTYRIQENTEIAAFKALIYQAMIQVGVIVLIGMLLAYFYVVSLISRPLRRLSSHIDQMRSGQGGYLSDDYRGPVAIAELENVRASLNDYQHQLENMHIDLATKNEELWKLAHHDPLTGIFNRRAFEDDWNALTRSTLTATVNVSFLLFDCDHFKAINDTYGHHVGDKILQGIANALYRALRAGDRLYRLGGDEFATILYETDIKLAQRVAERCIEAVKHHDFTVYGMHEPVRISIGIAHSHDPKSATLLHKHADMAMYHAKRPGNSKIAIYNESLNASTQAMLSSPETVAIYNAITDPSQLEIHYQKIVRLPAVEVDYFEALVRVRHGDTLLYPLSIFTVVEAKRLEIEFDHAVIDRLRQDMANQVIPEGTGVSINISGMSIVTQQITERLLTLCQFMNRYKLVIEVTETSLITQISHASSNLERLRKAGFIIALDDFGSGYSSLRYLSTMPVDLVKFDISMVRCLESEDRQRIIVENLARLVNAAGFQMVAEGIESASTLERVTTLGFTHAQGYFLGKPAPLKR